MIETTVKCDACGLPVATSCTGDVRTYISPAPNTIPPDTEHFHVTAFSKVYGKQCYQYCTRCLERALVDIVNRQDEVKAK